MKYERNGRTIDLSETLDVKINFNPIIDSIIDIIELKADETIYDTLTPPELIGAAESLIELVIDKLKELWLNDIIFKQAITCFLIANSDLDKLCNTRKYLN